MLQKNKNILFTSSNNFLNIVYKKNLILKNYNNFFILNIFSEDKVIYCLLDDYKSNKILNITKYQKKYSYVSFIKGTYLKSRNFKFINKFYNRNQFSEETFLKKIDNGLHRDSFLNSKFNSSIPILFKRFILYKPIKGGFFGYWFGFFGYISKLSVLKSLKYVLQKFNFCLWRFVILFNSIKINTKFFIKKKKKQKNKKSYLLKKFNKKIFFKVVFFFV